jgi:hypothetical protein
MQGRDEKYSQLKLNADDADFAIAPDEVINSENVRYGSTDAGVIKTIESIGSTRLVSTPVPSVTHVPVGQIEDEENGRIITLLHDLYASQDKIMCHYPALGTEYIVLLSSQVTGGLNFDKDSPIHSLRIVNGMLYWVDSTNNQPRKINIDSGILLNQPSFDSDAEPYISPLNFSEITIIKPPPALAPNISKAEDSGFVNNFIYNQSFEFAYQFVYYDNETSVVGCYSPASRLNVPGDTYNYISVVMDALQQVPNTVRMVRLIVRIGNSNNAFAVKTWDKEVQAELDQIEDQNANIQLLTFNFYNNITGEALSTAGVLKGFDNVPVYARTLETAKNRLFLGNIVSGYATPNTTSLEVTQNVSGISGTTSVIKSLIEVRAKVGVPGDDNDFAYGGWYVYLTATDISVPGYYLVNGTEKTLVSDSPYWYINPILDAPPSSVSIAGLTFIGATQGDVTDYIVGGGGNSLEGSAFYTRSSLITITGITSATDAVFKSRSTYKVGIVFYDFAMRKCGVLTGDDLTISIASRNYNYTTAVRSLTWTLDNTDALTEIPDWAYYYTIVRTLNLRTRYFVDAFTAEAKYVTKDADGVYEFTNDTYVPNAVGIGLDTTALVQAGLGYSFTQGDVAILTDQLNNIYELPVIAQYGNYIIVSAQDIGDLSTKNIIYEIYTPYQSSDQEPFYETGQLYVVDNPGTSSREYSVTTDILAPDVYTITRNFDADTYLAEGMSPNDLFYQTWYNDSGKPNFITKLGQVEKPNFIAWSNVYIPGTSVNGLSTFDALDQQDVPEDCGSINRLMLTSKVQGEGTVMLAICAIETVSLYLGEQQIYDSAGASEFLSSSASVIGTINVLKGSYGCIDPTAVCAYRGLVFYWDRINGKIIQYSANGLFPISQYKMSRFWKLFSTQYAGMTLAEIEAFGSRPFVYMTVDPRHNELLIAIPKLAATPPKGYLLDYTTTPYLFDILDYRAKVIVYRLEEQPNCWQGAYTFSPEGLITLNNQLYSYKNGYLYQHNQTSSYNSFYGTQYTSKIMVVSNQVPTTPKVYNNVWVQANLTPTLIYFMNEFPNLQISDLVDTDFRQLEGMFYASIYRNKIIPTADGYTTDGLLTQEKLRTTALKIMVEFSPTTTALELKFLAAGYTISSGHKTNIK